MKMGRLSLGRQKDKVMFPVAPTSTAMPKNYASFLLNLKKRIKQERLRVVMASNSALVILYWDIGKSILGRQKEKGWGAKVIDRLSADLGKEFPDMKGFSPRNLKYMRAFAAAWPKKSIVQEVLAQLTWYHNLALLDKLKGAKNRLWYAHKTIENGWSRSILAVQIESRLHERQGKVMHNFPAALPPTDSDMAAQAFKDPYIFDFLGTADPRREAELEPGHVSQLNMYLNVVDDILRHHEDKPTIGLLLVKQKNKLIAEYALRGYAKPIGIAQWKTQITRSLPETLKSSLPPIEEIEAELSKNEEDYKRGGVV